MIGVILSDLAADSIGGIKSAGNAGYVSGLNMMAARLGPGAISDSSSGHLPSSEASKLAKPVMFAVERSSRATMRWANRVGHVPEDDRDRPRLPLDGNGRR